MHKLSRREALRGTGVAALAVWAAARLGQHACNARHAINDLVKDTPRLLLLLGVQLVEPAAALPITVCAVTVALLTGGVIPRGLLQEPFFL